jgi:hypothetical protein
VADGLFVDMRRFAVPPGRPHGGERFERRPPRQLVRRLVDRWWERWRGTDGDARDLPWYLPSDWS